MHSFRYASKFKLNYLFFAADSIATETVIKYLMDRMSLPEANLEKEKNSCESDLLRKTLLWVELCPLHPHQRCWSPNLWYMWCEFDLLGNKSSLM